MIGNKDWLSPFTRLGHNRQNQAAITETWQLSTSYQSNQVKSSLCSLSSPAVRSVWVWETSRISMMIWYEAITINVLIGPGGFPVKAPFLLTAGCNTPGIPFWWRHVCGGPCRVGKTTWSRHVIKTISDTSGKIFYARHLISKLGERVKWFKTRRKNNIFFKLLVANVFFRVRIALAESGTLPP